MARQGIINMDAGALKVLLLPLLDTFPVVGSLKAPSHGIVSLQVMGDHLPPECEGKCLPLTVEFGVQRFGSQQITVVKSVAVQTMMPEASEGELQTNEAPKKPLSKKEAERAARRAAKPAGKLGRRASSAAPPVPPEKIMSPARPPRVARNRKPKADSPAAAPAASNDS